MTKGLSSLATYIANRAPQCPPAFRSNSNKVDFLKQAVLDQPWAREILVRINPGTQFQALYTELANALQLHEEIQQRSGGSSSKAGSSTKSSKPFIYFTQPRVVKSMAKAMFPGNEHDRACWNCDRKGHHFSKCHKELDLARIAAKKADYFAKKGNKKQAAKRVLYELVSGLSSLCDLDEEVSATESVKAFFGDLIDQDDASSSSSSDEDRSDEYPKEAMFTASGDKPTSDHAEYDSDF